MVARNAVLVVAVVVLTLSIALSPRSASGQEVVIRFLSESGGAGKSMTGGVQLFNETFKGKYRVEQELVDPAALLDKQMLQYVSRRAFFDVIAVNVNWIPAIGQYLTQLDPYLQRDRMDPVALFGAKPVELVKHSGRVIAMPVRIGVYMLFYRKDLFTQAGLQVPKTLEEYRETASSLTRRRPDGFFEVFGTSFQAKSAGNLDQQLTAFVFPNGFRYLTSDLQQAHPSLRSPEFARLAGFLRSLVPYGPNPLSWDFDDNVLAFQQGRLAMSIEFSPRVQLMEDSGHSRVAGKMGYTFPAVSTLGPEPPIFTGLAFGVAIDSNSPKKDAAWEFVKFMVSVKAQREMALNWANGPTVLEVLRDREYLAAIPAARTVATMLATRGWVPQFPVPQQPQLRTLLHAEAQLLLAGRTSPADFGRRLYEGIEVILRK